MDLNSLKTKLSKLVGEAKPHLEQAKAALHPLEVVPGTIGRVATVAENGLSAFEALLAELNTFIGAPTPQVVDNAAVSPGPEL